MLDRRPTSLPSWPGLLLATAIALAIFLPTSAMAYRPFNSTDAAVAGKGEMEIELGPVQYLRIGPDNLLNAPSLVLNWGVFQGWELVLEGKVFVALGSSTELPRFVLDDTALSLKGILREGCLQEKTGVSIATELGALLPTVNGQPGAGAQGALIVSQRWEALTIHLNGAVAWTRSHSFGYFGGIIVEGPDAWVVRPVAEFFVEGQLDEPAMVSGLVGVIWHASDGLSFDVALRVARAGDVNELEVRMGLTWAFSLGFP